mmetsp:Transcript_45083/g.141920  ORF Transcript_45083/g.141920 Transcript_45083/m.141920 type:complete len:208 (-) Transcript_45083:840-1463(-)
MMLDPHVRHDDPARRTSRRLLAVRGDERMMFHCSQHVLSVLHDLLLQSLHQGKAATLLISTLSNQVELVPPRLTLKHRSIPFPLHHPPPDFLHELGILHLVDRRGPSHKNISDQHAPCCSHFILPSARLHTSLHSSPQVPLACPAGGVGGEGSKELVQVLVITSPSPLPTQEVHQLSLLPEVPVEGEHEQPRRLNLAMGQDRDGDAD